MKRLGIDYGTKKVGLAITNDDGTMAFPHKVIPNDTKLLETLEAVVEKEGIDEIVIGQSLDGNNAPNAAQAGVEALMTDLTLQLGVPIHLEPEQYTTQAALRTQGRNDMTDASAAALILDSYISKLSN